MAQTLLDDFAHCFFITLKSWWSSNNTSSQRFMWNEVDNILMKSQMAFLYLEVVEKQGSVNARYMSLYIFSFLWTRIKCLICCHASTDYLSLYILNTTMNRLRIYLQHDSAKCFWRTELKALLELWSGILLPSPHLDRISGKRGGNVFF